jgi:hypothetical protein
MASNGVRSQEQKPTLVRFSLGFLEFFFSLYNKRYPRTLHSGHDGYSGTKAIHDVLVERHPGTL